MGMRGTEREASDVDVRSIGTFAACVGERVRKSKVYERATRGRETGGGEDEDGDEAKKVAERSWSLEGVRFSRESDVRTPQVQRTDEEGRAEGAAGSIAMSNAIGAIDSTGSLHAARPDLGVARIFAKLLSLLRFLLHAICTREQSVRARSRVRTPSFNLPVVAGSCTEKGMPDICNCSHIEK